MYCCHRTLSRGLHNNLGIFIIVEGVSVLPVDRRPCLRLSAFVLHCFHLATIFKSVGATIFLKRCNH